MTSPNHYLRPLLAPNSVVLVGASDDGSVGRIVYENLQAGGFVGDLFAVDAAGAKRFGRKALRSLRALTIPVDLAIICAAPARVPEILADCRDRARAAVILSGAPNASPAEYQRWLREVATAGRKAGVRILGPASLGIMRPALGLNASVGAIVALPGRLALISQSGAVAGALLDFARAAGIGFASVSALGAAVDVDFGEILEFALADPETDGIVLYVETLRDARVFLSGLRAAARTKPVVVLKAGRAMTMQPRAGDGALPPDRVFSAALRRAGTVRVHNYTQLLAAAVILQAGRIPAGNRLAIVTNGRGPGLLAADRATDAGVALARPTASTCAALRALLPGRCDAGNPVDVQGEATAQNFAAAVRLLLDDPEVDAVLALHVATPSAPPVATAQAVAVAVQGTRKPLLAAWLGAVDRPEARVALERGGAVNFYTPENAVEAFSFLAAYRRNQQWLLEVPAPQAEPPLPDIDVALRVRARAIGAKRSALTAGEVQLLLAAFGIPVALAVVTSAADAQVAARQIGYPVALEIEADGQATPIRTNIRNSATLARAHAELRRATPVTKQGEVAVIVRKDPRPPMDQMLKIVIYTDAVFGPVIGFGAASARAAEFALMLPPLNRRLAIDLVGGMESPALGGAGEALVEMLLKLSALACASPWVTELELGPVYVARGVALVLGANAGIDLNRPPTSENYGHMAIHPYPAELETELPLEAGVSLRVRPIRPEDAAMEQAFVAALSERSRYLRFMQHLPGLTPQMLERFTQVDYDRELALIALDETASPETIVAVARYVANWDRESAEFAIVVADDWQGRGLGFALMRLLINCARKRGFRRLVGSVLAINAPMLGLMTALGFVVATDPNDRDQVIVTLELRAAHK
ncbi:MAG: GNAT family N-acetyltransferase [Casimicrobiaceae bacterium]